MDGPSGIEKGIKSLENFERALSHVRNSARPLTLISRDELGACVSAADRAKHNLQLAYGVTSLFYMFLKTQGVAPADHPVKAELDRIRGYFAKLKQARKPPEQRKLKVDAAASRRFIDNALSGDNVWKSARGQLRREQGGRRTEEGIGRSMPAGQPEGFRYHQGDDRKNREVVSASSSSLSPSLPTPGAPATSLLRGNVGKRRHATDSGKNDEDDSVGTLGKRKKQLRGGADGVGGSRGDDGSREPDEKAKHDGPLVGAGGNHRSTQGASSKLATTAGVGDPTAAGVGPSRKTQCDHQRRK